MIACTMGLIPILGFAQQPVDSAAVAGEKQEEGFSFRPEGLRLGIDASNLISNLLNKDRRFYEANVDVSFGKYLLSADLGTGMHALFADGLEYHTSGNYFRIGPDINFIPESDDKNAFFVGLRYGRSSFEEKLNTTFFVPGWNALEVNPNRQASARWFEGVVGLKARVWNNFYLGYTLRYKFGAKVKDDEGFTAYEVPGFGKLGDGNTFSFNYHIFYRIPLMKNIN